MPTGVGRIYSAPTRPKTVALKPVVAVQYMYRQHLLANALVCARGSPRIDGAGHPFSRKALANTTDIGAPLSHAAIVARGLGIPAVVSCSNATMRLKTGDNS